MAEGRCVGVGRTLATRLRILGSNRGAAALAPCHPRHAAASLEVVGLARHGHRALVVHRRRRDSQRCSPCRGKVAGVAGAARRAGRGHDRGWCVGHAARDHRGHAPPEAGFRPRRNLEPGAVCRLTTKPFDLLSDDDLATCVHCGLCLDACPTFRTTGLETESPRGRIYLMTQWKRGTLPFEEEQVRHIDLCLGCRTCEAVCPSGVPYGRIIEAGRAEVEKLRRPAAKRTLSRVALRQLLAHPARLRAAGAVTRAAQALKLTSVVRSGRQLPPLRPQFRRPAGNVATVIGPRKYRVAFLVGCVMPILYPQSHEAAVKLLQIAGCEVWFPRAERCCGALLAHNGDL